MWNVESMSLSQRTTKKKRRAQSPSIVIQKPFEGSLLYKGVGKKKVNTTIGDLVCAVYDAANEISRNEKLVNHLTEMALNDILRKKASKKS